MYTYKRPHPAVAVDIIIFTIREETLKVLLIKRGVEPFLNQWAFPGGFVRIDEGLDEAARRELEEETGISNAYLDQLASFGQPDRDPRERVISVAYSAIISSERISLTAGTDAQEAQWHPYENLPGLAFDHSKIIAMAYDRLVENLKRTTIALQFLPEEFTLTELQQIHESVLREPVDKRNFRKWVNTLEYIEPTGRKETGGQHRPAEYYRATSAIDTKNKIAHVPAKPRNAARQSAAQSNDDPQVAYSQGFADGLAAIRDEFLKAVGNVKPR